MNETVFIRILSCFVLFIIVFNLFVVISFYLLPQGFLLSKNAVLDWETPNNVWNACFQIFTFNLLSVACIVFANFFAFPSKKNPFVSLGYYLLFIQYTLNAITLGTWSFTAVKFIEPALINRVFRTFNLTRAGIWEMIGQLLIASATARIAISRQNNIDVYNHKLKKQLLSRTEIVAIIIGFFLMIIGAYIESQHIIAGS